MSLIETNLVDITKRQYVYKLKAYMGLFFSLIFAQLIGLVFSFGGTGGSSTSSESISVRVQTYSGDIIIVFTIMWAFIVAILFTTKMYRDIDFSFVSNRLSSNLSSIALLITTSFAGGLAAILLTIVYRTIIYFYVGAAHITNGSFLLTPYEIVLGMFAIAFYMLLVSGVGYFLGVVAQISRIFIVLLPTILFGTLILETRAKAEESVFFKAAQFYLYESSFALFAIKVIVTAAVLFIGATILSNRLEVRK